MRTIMLLPSSPFLSRPMGPVKCLLAAVLVGLLDRGSAVADASDATESAPSAAYFTGRIEQDTTWRDTVYVGGDVTIASAATLTLAPNTQVHFLPYHDETQGGLDSTRAELIVEGRLAAQAGGIVFRSADAGSLGADWYGLVVERGGIADVSNAAIRDGLRCLYTKRDGRVTMDSIAFANCGKPTDVVVKVGVPRTVPPKVVARRENEVWQTSKRIGSKLIGGTLVGFISGIMLGNIIPFGYYTWLISYPVGTAVGVSAIDSYDRFLYSLTGSLLGAGGSILLLNDIDDIFNPSGPFAISSSFMATLASELSRKSPESGDSGHLSVALVPSFRGAWSAVATLRF